MEREEERKSEIERGGERQMQRELRVVCHTTKLIKLRKRGGEIN